MVYSTANTATTTPLRSVSPSFEGEVLGDDQISPTPPLNYLHGVNYSRPQLAKSESSGVQGVGAAYFRSRRVRKGDVDKPWQKHKNPKDKWVTIIPSIGIALGVALGGFLVYDGITSVVANSYKLVYEDNFSSGLDPKVWTKEVETGGFG